MPTWRANHFTISVDAHQSVYNGELNFHLLDEVINPPKNNPTRKKKTQKINEII